MSDNIKNKALWVAARTGRLAVCTDLIERGADIESGDFRQCRPLHLSAQHEDPSTCRMLIERGVNITALSRDDWTALHWAAWRGRVDTCQLLIEHGIDVHGLDAYGRSALHLAASTGETPVCLRLLELGASWLLKSMDGRTVAQEAILNNQSECAGAIASWIAARAARAALQEITAGTSSKATVP